MNVNFVVEVILYLINKGIYKLNIVNNIKSRKIDIFRICFFHMTEFLLSFNI